MGATDGIPEPCHESPDAAVGVLRLRADDQVVRPSAMAIRGLTLRLELRPTHVNVMNRQNTYRVAVSSEVLLGWADVVKNSPC